jgi:hypothetical protein
MGAVRTQVGRGRKKTAALEGTALEG